MAEFLQNLWESIFTPGPTPTLLIATNLTFAALQVLFLALLLATYSVHFIILSVLTAGLWKAINWFAGELQAAQEKEEQAKRLRDIRRRDSERAAAKAPGPGGEGEGMDTGDDTETETETEVEEGKQSKVFVPRPAAQEARGQRQPLPVEATQLSAAPATTSTTTGAQTLLDPLVDDAIRQRRSSGEVYAVSEGMSTDSEWEKVDEQR